MAEVREMETESTMVCSHPLLLTVEYLTTIQLHISIQQQQGGGGAGCSELYLWPGTDYD